MIEKIVAIKEKSSLLYYLTLLLIALPVVALIFISVVSPAIRAWLVSSAQKLMNSTKKKDEQIKQELQDLQNQVDDVSKKDDDLKKKIAEAQSGDDADWHKKG